MTEVLGVKQYVQDIFVAIKMIDNCNNDADEKFYKLMAKYIREYTKTHKLFMTYTMGKMSFNNVKHILGMSDREIFRYLEKQRKKFIGYIEQKELLIDNKLKENTK